MPSAISRRQFFLLTGAATAATGLVAGCGEAGSDGSARDTIGIWSAFSSKAEQNYFQKNTVDAYNSSHKAKLELSVKQYATMNQLEQTALAAGHGPDIVGSDGPTIVVDFADAGYVAPLDKYSKQYDWPSKLQSWALETGTSNGKLYGLPTSYESMILLYNPATFERNGWSVPKSRADFESICADAQGRGILPVAAGNAGFRKATEHHVTAMFNQYAGPTAVHSALTGKVPWDSAPFVDSITLLASYFKKHWYGGGPQSYFTYRSEDLYPKLASGEAAMMVVGSWGFGELVPYFGKAAGNKATWDWAQLPKFSENVPDDSYVLAIGGDNSINSKSKNPDAAAQFLDWELDPKRNIEALVAINAELPPIKVQPSDFPSNADERIKRFYLALNATRHIGYATWTSFPPKTDTYIYQSMDKVITGDMSPADFCSGMDAVFKPELKAGKVPPLSSPQSGN